MGKLAVVLLVLLALGYVVDVESMSLNAVQEKFLIKALSKLAEREKSPKLKSTDVKQSRKLPEEANGNPLAGSFTGEGTIIQVDNIPADGQKITKRKLYNDNKLLASKEIHKRATAVSGACPTNPTTENNPCKNYGVCISSEGGHTCLCKAGWTGNDCSQDAGNTENPNTLFVNNGVTVWGSWKTKKTCPKGHFVTGFHIRFTGDQGGGDDSGVSKLELVCTPPDGSTNPKTHLQSDGQNWGSWTSYRSCPYNYYIVNFNQQVDPDSGGCCDDWGTAGFKFTCRGPGLTGTSTQELIGNTGGSGWGNWGTVSATCPSGSAVCAMQTKHVAYQGGAVWNDDVDMVDTKLWCCNFESEASRYLISNLNFDIDLGKLLSKAPKVVATLTLTNQDNSEVTLTPKIDYEKTSTDTWANTLGLSVGVSTEISVGSEALGIKASFGIEVKSSYSTSWGQSKSESIQFSPKVTVKVPARSISVVEMMLNEAELDIPYMADLTTYFVGTTNTDTRKISGLWKSTRALTAYSNVKPAIPIP